jgi:hypothetical protein
MGNFKRRRAKHQRSGCLWCKPHKDDRLGNSILSQTTQERRQQLGERADRRAAANEECGSDEVKRRSGPDIRYTIEWRRRPDKADTLFGLRWLEWRRWPTTYRTERSRDQALESKRRKCEFWWENYEWRVGPTIRR